MCLMICVGEVIEERGDGDLVTVGLLDREYVNFGVFVEDVCECVM